MIETPPHNSNTENGKELPSALTVSKFTAARGKEIQIMKKLLSSRSGTKLAFQKLPKHMRRRAMSHNVKRLPRRLREIHLNQMKKSGLPPKQKRPSRKYRRRPYNLMNDYMRRQRKHKWLDTHIWHAKRFHMIEKWGYKLPFCPCDRAFRACYRATVNHCLLQDISYYRCIEIEGEYNTIINNFKKITNPNIGLTIAAKSVTKGSREGTITIFRYDHDKKAIGTVYFNWKPSESCSKRVLWIWVHAAYYTETLDILISCFNLESNSMETDLSEEEVTYEDCNNTVLKELKLNRFRLTGMLSHTILQNCFKLAEYKYQMSDCIQNYYGNSSSFQSNVEYWNGLKNISSSASLPPNLIISLNILDPRFNLPKKRTKAQAKDTETSNCICTLPENGADGPIWDHNVRKIVKADKISNAQIAELRRNLLVPGSDLDEKAAVIPIMLVQRPGKSSLKNNERLGIGNLIENNNTRIYRIQMKISWAVEYWGGVVNMALVFRKMSFRGYGHGWDIIIPLGWAQPIWISLIMWGARAGGLRESESITFEMGQPNFLYPDTVAGAEEESYISKKCKERFFKLPPNKRTNYNKFRIASPFEWNWNLLLSNWNINEQPIKNLFVLRDKKNLKHIQDLLSSKSKCAKLSDYPHNCLLPVCIELLRKGLCKQFSVICLPKEEDFKKLPIEPKHVDENERLRKELRREHKALLKKLRRRRIRAKRNGQVIPVDMNLLKTYTSKMRKLWLPEATTIRQSCSREVIGFVRHGDFSFLLGQSKASGYIAMGAVQSLLKLKCKNKVLVRNTNSKQYRLGMLEIVIP